MSGSPIVRVWPLAVHIWLACGARAVRIWLARGAHEVRVWLARGAHAVRVWLARDLLTWLLEFEPPNLQDFTAFILGSHGCKAYS